MNWIGTIGGLVMAAMVCSLNPPSIDHTVPELEARLTAENNRRDTLQKQLEHLTPTLEKSRADLKKLLGRKRDAGKAEELKNRIRILEQAKLRVLGELLKVQERRADLLARVQRLKRQGNELEDLTPEEQIAAKKKIDDTLRAAEETSRKREVNLKTFREEIDNLTQLHKEVVQKQQESLEKKLSAEKLLAKAKLFGKEGDVAFHQREYEVWDAAQEEANKKVRAVQRKLLIVKKEFERYVELEAEQNVLLPGETLELYVAEERTLNGLYTVRRGGYVVVPQVGKVILAGLSLGEAEETLKAAIEASGVRKATVLLERPEAPDMSLMSKEDRAKATIYLNGAFKKPGPWPIPKGFQPTLVTAIIRSGGAARNGDLENVRVMRVVGGKGLNETINVKAILEGRNVASDIKLRPEDIVIIPARKQKPKEIVFITGLVKRPGPQEVTQKKPLTVHRAILQAGGFDESANISKVFVLRKHGSGRKIHIPVDIRRIRRGAIPDLKLLADDVVVVPGGILGRSY